MKIINQTENSKQASQIQSVGLTERIQSEANRATKEQDRSKKIPDDISQFLSNLIAQLPPDTVELIQKFALMSGQKPATNTPATENNTENGANESDQLQIAGAKNADQGGVDVAAADQSESNGAKTVKRRADLDDMLLAALSTAIVPQPPVPTASIPNAKENAGDKDAHSVQAQRAKAANKDSDDSQSVQNQNSQTESVKSVNEPHHVATHAAEKGAVNMNPQPVLAQPVVSTQQLAQAQASNPGRQATVTVGTVSATSQSDSQLAELQGAQRATEPKALHANTGHGSGNADAASTGDDEAIGPVGSRKRKAEDNADASSMPQQVTTQPPGLQIVPQQTPQAQSQAATQTQQAMERHKIALAAKDKAGTQEGVRYNLDSWGQNQSVQIVGSNKAGYTLRPSDEQVHGALEKHNKDDLNITIADAPDGSGSRSDIDKISIQRVSGNDSAT